MFTYIKKFKLIIALSVSFFALTTHDNNKQNVNTANTSSATTQWGTLPNLAKYSQSGIGLQAESKSFNLLSGNKTRVQHSDPIADNSPCSTNNNVKFVSSKLDFKTILPTIRTKILPYALKYSFFQDLVAGVRVFAHYKIGGIFINAIFFSLLPDFKVPNQFTQAPSMVSTMIYAPILEESVFTHGLGGLVNYMHGPIAAKFLVPVLFGLLHRHENPYMWLLMGLHAGLLSFLNITNLQENPNNIFSPMIVHVLNNALAMYANRNNY